MLEKFEITTKSGLPVDIEDIKTYMHVSGNSEDFILNMIANAVKAELEDMLGRVFLQEEITATYLVDLPLISKIRGIVDRYEPYRPLEGITLVRTPVVAVSLVSLETAPEVFTDLNPSVYGVNLSEPATITPYSDAFDMLLLTYTQARLRVVYTVGYATPDAIPDWMILQFYQLFAARYADREGMTLPQTFSDAGVFYRTPRV